MSNVEIRPRYDPKPTNDKECSHREQSGDRERHHHFRQQRSADCRNGFPDAMVELEVHPRVACGRSSALLGRLHLYDAHQQGVPRRPQQRRTARFGRPGNPGLHTHRARAGAGAATRRAIPGARFKQPASLAPGSALSRARRAAGGCSGGVGTGRWPWRRRDAPR